MPKKRIEVPKPELTLEQQVMQCPCHGRDTALAELGGSIERVLRPRNIYKVAGSADSHFLRLPTSPQVSISRGGMPAPGDAEEEADFRAKMVELTRREQQLTDLAQKARNIGNALQEWGVALGAEEDRLLLSVLAEQDRPAVENYVAAHKRFVRTCRAWVDKLTF